MENTDILKRQRAISDLKLAILNDITKGLKDGLEIEDVIGAVEAAKHVAATEAISMKQRPLEFDPIGYR